MAPLWKAVSELASGQRPFLPQLVVSGQDRTELDQALGELGIHPDEDLEVMEPYLADANLNGKLLRATETVVRHHRAAGIVVAGASATAWAGAITAYFKGIPLIRVDQGNVPLAGERPMPEWLHLGDLRRLANLHLCADEQCADFLRNPPVETSWGAVPETAEIAVVGDPIDQMLNRALERAGSLPPDPALTQLRPEAPRVLAYLRRREHHADGLRPLCDALEVVAPAHPDCDFVVLFSLQSHVVDALRSLVPRRDNIHTLCPLPHSGFVRLLAPSRLVVTDSLGIAHEALRLGRPTLMAGRYSASRRLESVAAASATPLRAAAMDRDAMATAMGEMLASESPASASDRVDCPDAGGRMLEILMAWWKKHDTGGEAR